MALQLLVVTGLSGAGKSTALRALEDLGYFCVDNIPPALIPQLMKLLTEGDDLTRVAVGIDVRTGGFLEEAAGLFDTLRASGHTVDLLFLECQDAELVRRFSETRRAHPLAPGGNLLEAIARERERLATLRARANLIIDTTAYNTHDVRRAIVNHMDRGRRSHMVTRVVSFGFKYGLPVDADLVFDVRFLSNPHFVPELRPKTGLDREVAEFVMAAPEAQELLEDLSKLLVKLLPRFQREGKSYLTIAIGCTGGRHRSVTLAVALGDQLRSVGEVMVEHRDIQKQTVLPPGALSSFP